jgi:MoaA/NifB/PqqE/SkfB family radical SAM enzyme
MSSVNTRFRRQSRALHRTFRELGMVAKALIFKYRPIHVQIIPTRYCNLDCGYCNEYDNVSEPVPLEEMYRRIDRLAELKTGLVFISGGEPLTHPQVDDIIRRLRFRGMLAGLITNGLLLTKERIEALNRAGLDYLQISIDNVERDEVSKKSLKVLDKKLEWLSQYAEFKVNINSVVGAGFKNPSDAVTITERARGLGFSSSVGIIHDGRGELKPLDDKTLAAYRKIKQINKGFLTFLYRFQDKLAAGEKLEWRCRAGARFLYICEHGLVHYCSQQLGYPGIPLAEYTVQDIRREFLTDKACASKCTIQCVHLTSYLDEWRAPQKGESHLVKHEPSCNCLTRAGLVQIAPAGD